MEVITPMMRDITADIVERMAKLQDEIERIKEQRSALDAAERQIDQTLQALRVTLEWERARQGESKITSAKATNGRNPWLGMPIADAVRQLIKEHPEWGRAEILERLTADGFDFKGKRAGNAVHMALVSVRRKGKP